MLAADKLQQTWVVMPAYNEERSVAAVLQDLVAAGFKVVVVDDGSRDSTFAEAQGLAVHVLRHCLNLGQGAALQTGIAFALRQGAKFIVTFDSDGQHTLASLERLLAPLYAGRCEVVLGSRFMLGGEASNIPAAKRLVLKLAILFSRLSTGLRLTDTHNGLRALSAAAARKLCITQNRMAHASQILSQIGEHRLRYEEVPVSVVYTDYSCAKGQRITNILNILWDSFAEVLRR